MPTPLIFEAGSQDKYISKANSFEVDYRFLAADYLTTCIDEQGVNFLLNYYNQKNNGDFADNVISPYLKQLTAIDDTDAGGGITNEDYSDWAHSFVQNDSFSLNNVTHSHLKDFVYNHRNFRTVDIRTKRGYNTTVPEDPYDPIHHHYDDTWQIWKNS